MKKIALLSALIAFSIFLQAQTIEDWFTFNIGSFDTINHGFLPDFENQVIDESSFVSVGQDGHFSVKNQPVRFWGTPSFPLTPYLNRDEYKIWARHLRHMGFNLVRFHMVDANKDNPPYTLFGNNEGTRTFDPQMVDQLDYAISEVKKQGIYIYLDLLVSRNFTESDGVNDPGSVNKALKEVSTFDPYLIELQKEYANNLLTHVNPYTGLALKDEPAIALIDIQNEAWFLSSARLNQLRPQSEGGLLSNYHYSILTDQWNDFLHAKYNDSQTLLEKWDILCADTIKFSNSNIEQGLVGWNYSHGSEVITSVSICETNAIEGDKSILIKTQQRGEFDWTFELTNSSLNLTKNTDCKLIFWANNQGKDTISVAIKENGITDSFVRFNIPQVILQDGLNRYELIFRTTKEAENNSKLIFYLGKVTGELLIDNVYLLTGNNGLPVDESFEAKNIKLISMNEIQNWYPEQRKIDQGEFYIYSQEQYFKTMRDYLKNELGVRVPITGTNFFHGIPDARVQSTTDFVDFHSYWQLGEIIPDKPMLSHPGFDNSVILFSAIPVKGKPLTVSEFNHTWPDPFRIEGDFFITAYGSFHGSDMIMFHGYDFDWITNQSQNNGLANIQMNTDKAMFPIMAYVFRNNIIKQANQTVNITYTERDVNREMLKDYNEGWNTYKQDFPYELMYKHAIRSEYQSEIPYNRHDLPETPTSPYISDTEEIEWDTTGLLSVATQQFCAFVGYPDKFVNKQIGAIKIIKGSDFSGLMLLALDSSAIKESDRMILSISTEQRNDEQVVANKTLVDYGHAPRIIRATSVTFELDIESDSVRIFQLNTKNEAFGPYKIIRRNEEGKIIVTIDTHEYTSLWFGVETGWDKNAVKLLQPNEESTIISGDTITFNWFSDQVEKIDIEWSADKGKNWNTIVNDFAATIGSYKWKSQTVNSDSCTFKITSHADQITRDQVSCKILDASQNLIRNGYFEEGISHWRVYNNNDEMTYSYSNKDEELFFEVLVPGSGWWGTGITQRISDVEQGHYRLSFDLRSEGYQFFMTSVHDVQKDKDCLWKESYKYRLNNNQHFEYFFDANTKGNYDLYFMIGQVKNNFSIDNVTLHKISEYLPYSDSVSVTFRVDMQNETVSDKGVHIGGGFESIGALSADGTIYSTTIKLKKGETLSYKFINGELYDWAKYETITGTCTTGDADDRWLLVPDNDVTLDVVCFGGCGACEPVVVSDSVNVTFRVDMSNETVSAAGINVIGSFSNWSVAKPMQLFSGGVVYATTLKMKKGETIEYKFVNGDWNEWAKYEILAGQECAFGKDANRGLVVPNNNVILDVVCFGGCGACVPVVASDSVNVTFRVDMQNETVSAAGVNINGSFSNWTEAKPMRLFSVGSVYATTMRLKKGETIEYKFVNGGTTNWDKYEIIAGQPCAFGNDANRGFVVPNNDTTFDVVCFGKCQECEPDNSVDIPFKNLMVFPNPTKGEVVITGLPNSEQKILNITNINGSVLQTIKVEGVRASVDLSTLNKGIYFLKISDRTSQRIFKVVKN